MRYRLFNVVASTCSLQCALSYAPPHPCARLSRSPSPGPFKPVFPPNSTISRAVDKYASTMNTERLRETLRKEVRLVKKADKENDARMQEYGGSGDALACVSVADG